MSYRHLEEMMHERGASVDHSTVNRWAIRFLPLIEKLSRQHKRKVGDLTVEVASHDAFAQQFKAARLGLNKTAPMVAAPFLPYCPSQPFCHPQDIVKCIGSTAVCLPGLGVLAGWDDGMRSAQSDGFMTVLRVVSAVASWGCDYIQCSEWMGAIGVMRRDDVPEPGSLALIGTGLSAALRIRRKARR